MKKRPTITKRIIILTLAALLSLPLSSCSVVQIHFDDIIDEFFPYDDTFEHETEVSNDMAFTDTDTGMDTVAESDDPADIYEYTGLAEATAYLDDIGDYSFGGGTVFIKTTATEAADQLFTAEDADENDTYAASIYERNHMVEERFECELRYHVTTLEEMLVDMEAAVTNEEYYADLLAVTQEELAILAKEGYLYNLRSLPFFETDKDYYNASASKALSAGYYSYGVIGTSTIDPDSISCVLANLDLASALYKEDLSELAASGGWTWNIFLQLTTDTSISIGGNVEGDGGIADLVSASVGLSLVGNEINETPHVVMPESAANVIDICRTLISERNIIITSEEEETDSFTSFLAGESAFLIGELGDMNALSDVSFDWTVLPMPKLSEEDAYRSCVSSDTLVFAVPVNTADPDGASVLLRAISAASAGYLRDVYVQYHMYNTVRHSETLSMIELIYETPFFSFEHSLGKADPAITAGTYEIIREAAIDLEANAEKLFDKRDSKADSKLESLYAPKN